MNKKLSNYIIFFSWFLFLVILWVIISFSRGENGQWWSMYRLNADKHGPWALEFSCIKISIAAIISLVIAYMVSFGFKRKR